MMVSGRLLSPHIPDASMENTTAQEEWQRVYIPIRAICLIISILGTIGNGILIHLLNSRINKTRFTIYFENVSMADFLFISSYLIDNFVFFASRVYSVSSFQFIIYLLGNDASIYFLTVISIERYCMIFSPVWYHSNRPKSFTAIMCVILWGLALVMTLLEYSSCHPKRLFNIHFNCDIVLTIHLCYNFMNFIYIMYFSILDPLTRILRPSQRNFPTNLDISITAAAAWVLFFWIPIKIIDLLHLWVPDKYLPDHYAASLVSESIYSSGRPYIYLLVGWWKSQELVYSIPFFIERALQHTEENIRSPPEDQEQA